jgi:hypothetical protein
MIPTYGKHIQVKAYISSLCPKPGVVSNNMTRGDNVVKSRGPTDPRWGQPRFGTNEIMLSTCVTLSR